jgi:hypothetical protein
MPNVSELSHAPSNPGEPKTLTGSSQKARSRLPHGDLGHTNSMTAGATTGTNSFVSSERNRINPSSRLIEAGVIARCAAGVPGRGCWKKRTSKRIGAATSPYRANGQTSSRSCVTRKLAKPS